MPSFSMADVMNAVLSGEGIGEFAQRAAYDSRTASSRGAHRRRSEHRCEVISVTRVDVVTPDMVVDMPASIEIDGKTYVL